MWLDDTLVGAVLLLDDTLVGVVLLLDDTLVDVVLVFKAVLSMLFDAVLELRDEELLLSGALLLAVGGNLLADDVVGVDLLTFVF